MGIKNLVPWNFGKKSLPVRREEEHPFYSLQREMNRMFDDFFSDFSLAPFGTSVERFEKFSPSINVTEDDKEVRISAELPGMDEKDIDVSLTSDTLTIKGEKEEKEEDKGKEYYRMERSYGSFQRVIPLPDEIDTEKTEASFKNGVLNVVLPKIAEAKSSRKKIAIKKE
ncbi:MAG: Hsp20/alpha crystallin family protein [Deltaproteobacteria bacterium]|nr:Hsp20/alpha crystallin family protein [Deltaproteobacteria bacterium]